MRKPYHLGFLKSHAEHNIKLIMVTIMLLSLIGWGSAMIYYGMVLGGI